MEDMTPAQLAKHDTLVYMQFEALSKHRKEKIVTTESKEHRSFVPVDQLEGHRLVNKVGTKESKAVKGKENALSGWNNVWTLIQDDGTAEEGLADVGTAAEKPCLQVAGTTKELVKALLEDSRSATNEIRISGRTVQTGLKARFATDETNPLIPRKRGPQGSSTSTTSKRIQAPQAPSSIMAPNGVRKRDIVDLNNTPQSFRRLERPYAGGPPLSCPETFMASIHSRKPPATLKAVSSEAAADIKTPVKARSPSETTSGAAINGAQAEAPYAVKLDEVATKATVGLQAHQPQKDSTVNLMDLDIAQTLPSQPVIQPATLSASAPSMSSLSAFLPVLRQLLPTEQYAIVEAMAGTPATSQAHVSCPQSTSNNSVTAGILPPLVSVDKPYDETSAEPATPRRALLTSLGIVPASSSSNEGEGTSKSTSTLIEKAIDDKLKLWFKEEDQNLVRCRVPGCTKRFKDENPWRIHVEKRHSDWLDGLKENVIHGTVKELETSLQNIAFTRTIAQDRSRNDGPSLDVKPAPPKADSDITKAGADFKQLEAASWKVKAAAKTVKRTSAKINQTPSTTSDSSSAPNPSPGRSNIAATANFSPLANSNIEGHHSLADGLARRGETIIGEHVYKTRFQPASALVEKFKNLTISEATVNALSNKATNSPPKSTSNPFGVPNAAAKRPTGPSLPLFLQQATKFVNPGAAAQAQYGGVTKADEPVAGPPRNPMASTSTTEARSNSLSSGSAHRITQAIGSRPSLPAFLQGASASSDLGAAARRQYGGKGADL
ncbi:MAG: hypothetical protein Q9217_003542 [Psora testacea]